MPRKLKLSFLNLTVTCGMWVFKTNFKRLLNSLTLNDVIFAISNAEKIEHQNMRDYNKINHCGYEYYRENPSLSIHKCVKDILKTVGLL